VHRFAVLVLLVAALAGCDRGGSGAHGAVSDPGSGLALTVRFDEPLRSGQAVTWHLEVENRGKDPVTLRFPSGKDGDVVLLRGSSEVYRWSANRLFSQALRDVPLGVGDSHPFKLEERSLAVPAGDYELVAQVAADPSPGAVRRPVTVR
jgi:hypothetical protein